MPKRDSYEAVLLACALALATSACGDDDGGAETPPLGTCDLRSQANSCIELHDASAADLENQEEGCFDAGGAWSNDACPTEDLVGCCEYEFGNSFRECFYVGIMRDPEAYCADTVSGTWSPAP
jgi:hypothetical protein